MAGIDNLTPFSKDDNRAREAGKKSRRGRSLSTIVKAVAENIDAWEKIPVKNKDVVKDMGVPIEAVVMVAFGQAITGDSSAREWLRRAGYGDNLDVTTNGEPINLIDFRKNEEDEKK